MNVVCNNSAFVLQQINSHGDFLISFSLFFKKKTHSSLLVSLNVDLEIFQSSACLISSIIPVLGASGFINQSPA